MGIYATDLRELIIRPVLEQLDDWSPSAENLLLGTAAHESQMAFRLHCSQSANAGLFRISPSAHIKVWDEFLVKDAEIASRLRGLASQQQFLKFPHRELITNLSYATGVAWMIYKSNQVQLPEEDDIYDLAHCWWNCFAQRLQDEPIPLNHQHQEIEKFVVNYRKLVLREHKKIAA